MQKISVLTLSEEVLPLRLARRGHASPPLCAMVVGERKKPYWDTLMKRKDSKIMPLGCCWPAGQKLKAKLNVSRVSYVGMCF